MKGVSHALENLCLRAAWLMSCAVRETRMNYGWRHVESLVANPMAIHRVDGMANHVASHGVIPREELHASG